MYKLLKKYISHYKLLLFLYAILFISNSALSLISPLLQSEFYDELIYGQDLHKIIQFIGCLMILGLSIVLISGIINLLLVQINEKISMEMKKDVLTHLEKSSLLCVEKMDAGFLTQQINSDCSNIMGIFLGNYVSFFSTIISLVVILTIIASINIYFLFIFLCFIPIYVIIYLSYRKKLYQYQYLKTEQRNKFFGVFQQQISSIRKVKQDALFYKSIKMLMESFQAFYKRAIKDTILSQFYVGSEQIVSLLFQCFMFILAGYFIFNHSITFGKITILLNYFAIIRSNIKYFMNLGELLQSAKVSSNRIHELFCIDHEKNGDKKLEVIENIKFENITFFYPEQKNAVLQSFSYCFNKGNFYTICGNNGVGKSTLINIVLGLYQQMQSGCIRYNGVDINQLDMYYLRENKIAVVSQSLIFMDNFVSEIFGVSESDFSNFIDSFGKRSLFRNEWFDVLLLFNKNIMELSGGEKQKIAICYALYKKPQLLLLDEPTSSLDAKSIPLFLELLHQIKRDKIIISVTHDEEIQKNSDFTLYLSTKVEGV